MVKVASRGANPPGLSRRSDKDSDRFYPHYYRGGAQQTLWPPFSPLRCFTHTLPLFRHLPSVLSLSLSPSLTLSPSLSLRQVHTCIDTSFSPAFFQTSFFIHRYCFLSLSFRLYRFFVLGPFFPLLLLASTFFLFLVSLPSGDLSTP